MSVVLLVLGLVFRCIVGGGSVNFETQMGQPCHVVGAWFDVGRRRVCIIPLGCASNNVGKIRQCVHRVDAVGGGT